MAGENKLVVLLLDDDPTWLRALGRLLERAGASVIALSSPEALFERISTGTPDVMALDFVLGLDETGADVARSLREHLRDSCPPLLLVSSSLPSVDDADFAPFDAAYDKATAPAQLVRYIIERAHLRGGSRSRPSLRGIRQGELGRGDSDDELPWLSEG